MSILDTEDWWAENLTSFGYLSRMKLFLSANTPHLKGFSRLDNKWAVQRAPFRHILKIVAISVSRMDYIRVHRER
ncbi:hypothetical protein Y032_0397g694 [Ancylostoma ceylanicum]|uniref:Uncharacterized protein n=1 Tax=Ancylostoma ceylanicum TaxID=53326 RepID=A0A016RRE1_9BILA|nr:hypothetical protein Y032_0397g694 [Ancylostoma ceylanicum]